MTRLSFRPRPLDVNKKLPIVRSIKELDGEDGVVSRSVHHGHIALDAENEPVLASPAKKGELKEIPIPESQIVSNFDTLYPRNFQQPATFVRRRPARAETEAFIEYDLDDDDEDWLDSFNNQGGVLAADAFEAMLYHLELADSRARMKTMTAAAAADSQLPAPPPFVLGVRVPVYLPLSHAEEILKTDCPEASLVAAVCDYWKSKRERRGKPILRRLQPPPAVTDTNPFNVFRPREKAHRPNTRRMQRRENDVASFEKLHQVKYNLEDAQKLLKVMQKREEAKKDLVDCEFQLQKAALKDPEVSKMYLERQAKRAKYLQQAAMESPWQAAGTPGGIRLKVHPPALPEDTTDIKSSLTKDSALDIVNKALNSFHTPVVTTKRRSASAANAAAQAAGVAAPTALLAAVAASNGDSFPPPPPVVRLRLSSPTPDATVGGDQFEGDGSLEIHQLQLQKRKRRRNTFPLRGAAAASVANSRKAQAGAVLGVNRTSKFPVLREPPRLVEPVMWFTISVNSQLVKKYLHVDTAPVGTRTAIDGSLKPANDLMETSNQLVPKTGSSDPSSAAPSAEVAAQPSTVSDLFPALQQDRVAFQNLRGRPRFGRGGRLVFDRWDVLRSESLGGGDSSSTETLDGPREKENVLGQDVGKLLAPPEEKGNSTIQLSLQLPVHKHRSQPRWRHTAAKPLSLGSKPGGFEPRASRGPAEQAEKVENDHVEEPQALVKASPLKGVPPPKARGVVVHKNGLHKVTLQQPNGIHDHNEMRAPVARNGLHPPVAQHLVPA